VTTATVKAHTDTSREALAVVLLTAGSVVPVLGWVAGLAVLCTSRLYETREKLAASLVLPGGLFAGWVAGSLITGVDPASCPGCLPRSARHPAVRQILVKAHPSRRCAVGNARI